MFTQTNVRIVVGVILCALVCGTTVTPEVIRGRIFEVDCNWKSESAEGGLVTLHVIAGIMNPHLQCDEYGLIIRNIDNLVYDGPDSVNTPVNKNGKAEFDIMVQIPPNDTSGFDFIITACGLRQPDRAYWVTKDDSIHFYRGNPRLFSDFGRWDEKPGIDSSQLMERREAQRRGAHSILLDSTGAIIAEWYDNEGPDSATARFLEERSRRMDSVEQARKEDARRRKAWQDSVYHDTTIIWMRGDSGGVPVKLPPGMTRKEYLRWYDMREMEKTPLTGQTSQMYRIGDKLYQRYEGERFFHLEEGISDRREWLRQRAENRKKAREEGYGIYRIELRTREDYDLAFEKIKFLTYMDNPGMYRAVLSDEQVQMLRDASIEVTTPVKDNNIGTKDSKSAPGSNESSPDEINYHMAPQKGRETIFFDDFEGDFFDYTWDVYDEDPSYGSDYWGIVDCQSCGTGERSAWCAGVGDMEDCHMYDYGMDSWMESMDPISTAGYTDIEFSYNIWYDMISNWLGEDECMVWYYDEDLDLLYLLHEYFYTSNMWEYRSHQLALEDSSEFRIIVDFLRVTDSGQGEGVYLDNMRVTGQAPSFPNLTYYTPPGWSDAIVVSPDQYCNTTPANLYVDETMYINWAIVNNGQATTGDSYFTILCVDRDTIGYYPYPPLDAGVIDSFYFNEPYDFSEGYHTVKIIIDGLGYITESNESDNQYQKTFQFITPRPNLTFYTPYEWDTSVIISHGPAVFHSADMFYSGEPAYLHWAMVNNGVTPSSESSTCLYIDDMASLYMCWNVPGLQIGQPYQKTAQQVNLAPGWHQLILRIDDGGAVDESNETDNLYVDQWRLWTDAAVLASGIAEYQKPMVYGVECIPIKGCRVELWEYDLPEETPRIKLAETYTNDSGYFEFPTVSNVDDDGTTLDIAALVYAVNDTVIATADTLGTVPFKFSTRVAQDIASGIYEWDYDLFYGFYERAIAPLAQSGYFYLHEILQNQYSRWQSMCIAEPIGITKATLDTFVHTHYNHDNNVIIVAADDSPAEQHPDTYDRDVIEHEFAHRIQHSYDFFDSGGGIHAYSITTDERTGASEGFANWWAVENNGYPELLNFYNNLADTDWCNLENGMFGNWGVTGYDTAGSANALGDRSEVAVAGMFWDLIDDTPGEDFSGAGDDWLLIYLPHHPDGIGDNIVVSREVVLQTILDKVPPAWYPKTMGDFWDLWFWDPSNGYRNEMIDLWYEHGVDKTDFYICGDANGDGVVDIGDPVYMICWIFKECSLDPPIPIEESDANCDGVFNIGDSVYMINFIFKGGPPPCDNCPRKNIVPAPMAK